MKKLLIILIQSAAALPLFAQSPPPSSVPLDPFAWVVLGAGAAIVGKRFYNSRKNR